MLVLSRRLNESIVIGDGIEVKVLQTGSTVQLGIVAPREVPVWRKEVFEEVARENARARDVDAAGLAALLRLPAPSNRRPPRPDPMP